MPKCYRYHALNVNKCSFPLFCVKVRKEAQKQPEEQGDWVLLDDEDEKIDSAEGMQLIRY